MNERIHPAVPSGFRDMLPADTITRQAMMDRISSVFERFGFSPIETPSLEYPEVLTGGDPEFKKQMYQVRLTDDDAPLALRFDLTVPLARYVAAHAEELQFPFLRYHIGKVWRGEHAQAGRYREFVQCDADIVGARPGIADAQIVALVHALFTELGLADSVRIRISHRKILNGLADFLQFDTEKTPAVLRAIDKLEKIGWAAVSAELRDKVGLDDQQIDGIQEFLDLKADTPEQLLGEVHTMLQFSAVSHPGIEALRECIKHLDAFGVPRTAWELDLSIVRGLGYYTGMVFETTIRNLPTYGSVCAGGRYDKLLSRFAPMELSGVGLSVGIDRLFAALDELGLLERIATPAKVAVLNFDPTCRDTVIGLITQLRTAGIATTLYLGSDENLKSQLAWAVKGIFPYVVIIGSSEKERGVVQLKDMSARTQEEVPVSELAARLQ